MNVSLAVFYIMSRNYYGNDPMSFETPDEPMSFTPRVRRNNTAVPLNIGYDYPDYAPNVQRNNTGTEILDVGTLQSDTSCRSRMSLEMFNTIISKFCSRISDDQIQLAQVFWLWIVVSCFDKVEYKPRLVSNSCNAEYTFMTCTKADREKYLIAKFQMSPDADNINIDNVNGALLNMLVPIQFK